jgi:multiple antibiotic resistance protein
MITQLISPLIHDTIALITILNPIAAAGIMVTMVTPPTPANIQPVATRATLTVLIASLVTLFTGEFIFKLFGINVYSIKVIGGIILMLIAINMAAGHATKTRHTPEEQAEAQEKEDISIIPLGIPILFGPGVIATIVVLDSHSREVFGPWISYALISAAILLSTLTVYLVLRNAGVISRTLGVTGMKIMTRIMGLIVGAIAAQFLIGGVKGLWMGH